MAWECAERGEDEDEGGAVFVCHHCGKPLCRRHGRKLADDAFGAADPHNERTAVHCSGCKREFHPRGSDIASQQPTVR